MYIIYKYVESPCLKCDADPTVACGIDGADGASDKSTPPGCSKPETRNP